MLRRQLTHALARRAAVGAPTKLQAPRVAHFASEASRRHVIAALVVNQPGCLAEIANMFAARGGFLGHSEEWRTQELTLDAQDTTLTASWSAAPRWRSSRA